MKLYDASAWFKSIQDRNLDLTGFVLDLTLYEVGNVVYKHKVLMRNISSEEAGGILKILENWENVIYIRPEYAGEIFKVAERLGLTYYDAAYVFYAKKYGLTTSDKKLGKKAAKMVKCNII